MASIHGEAAARLATHKIEHHKLGVVGDLVYGCEIRHPTYVGICKLSRNT